MTKVDPDRKDENRRFVSAVAFVAAMLAAVMMVSYQAGFLPFFQPLFSASTRVWPIIYYGFWSVSVAVALFLFLSSGVLRRRALPLAILCACAIVLCALHPLDYASKNFVVAMVLAGCLSIFLLALPAGVGARFCAAVTVLAAFICLLDILFADGFTNSAGRAAGLAVNANDAAAGLLLGLVATFGAVPVKWRLPFCLLVGTALVATLSRSTMVVAAAVLAFLVVVGIFRSGRRWKPRRLTGLEGVLNGALLLVLVCWIAAAGGTNDYFSVAASNSLGGLGRAAGAFIAAENEIESAGRAHRSATSPHKLSQAPPSASSSKPASSSVSQNPDAAARQQMERLGEAAKEQGMTNSAASRALLLKRSIIAFRTDPFLGRGLQAAMDLSPHNTFLLFAVAFGWLGLLIPLGFLAVSIFPLRDPSGLAFALTVAGLMMFSHSVLLIPALVVPVVVGIAERLKQRDGPALPGTAAVAAMRTAGAVTPICVLAGCLAIAVSYKQQVMTELLPDAIWPNNGVAYHAMIYPPRFQGLLRTVSTWSGDTPHALAVFEDKRPTAPAQAETQDASRISDGAFFQYRRNQVAFTATDNSDPRVNGRTYTVREPLEVHPLMFLIMIATFAWGVAIAWFFSLPPALATGEPVHSRHRPATSRSRAAAARR